ncbi:MAG: acetyl-CoA decarbonylase/synthase complex subunit alpha/beta [Methanomassiliicoccales archaeon]
MAEETDKEHAESYIARKDLANSHKLICSNESLEAEERISREKIFRMAVAGAQAILSIAERRLESALKEHGDDFRIEFPDTAYHLPSILAWEGEEVSKLGQLSTVLTHARTLIKQGTSYEAALSAGEATMIAAEIIEALKYSSVEGQRAPLESQGFIPDRTLRELGVALVDDTIPGCAVIMGSSRESKKLAKLVRELQSKGILILATKEIIHQLQDEAVKIGPEVRLFPLGDLTQAVHAINFAIRVALTFGNVQSGDRERLAAYLQMRPKVFVIHLGRFDDLTAAICFAALFNGWPIITDQDIEPIPDRLIPRTDYDRIVQTGVELRGMKVKAGLLDIPVAYGSSFEGEIVRRPDTYVEAGGASRTPAFELLRARLEDEVVDGRITLMGKDVDELPEGSSIPLAILVDVYGKRMEEDFEPVLERRIHQFINYAEGAWHTGQRDAIWVRLSKSAVKRGLRLKHFGDILVAKIKAEFANIVSRVQVTIVTDEAEVQSLLPMAKERYKSRDERLGGLTDEAVQEFYSCSLCQSFAPDHVCIITPERLGLCGALNWLDAKAAKEIAPRGPNQPVPKGEVIDPVKGQWSGVNEMICQLSHGRLQRFNAYTIMEDPMTACGCFEVIVAMTADAQAVILVDRDFTGMTPIGMKFSTLAGHIGGGRQTPGFIGIGRKYILSKKFIAADGGLLRVAWMPKGLKERLKEGIMQRAKELGEPDLLEKIADETITDSASGLAEWMAKVRHPALKMSPLLS